MLSNKSPEWVIRTKFLWEFRTSVEFELECCLLKEDVIFIHQFLSWYSFLDTFSLSVHRPRKFWGAMGSPTLWR
jgi:hypothetical protein